MTNTSSSASMGWEVAGGKKANKKPAEIKPKSGKENILAKFPKQETLQPIKLEKTIYDYIRESDDDSDEMDEVNNNKVKPSKLGSGKKEAAQPNGLANGGSGSGSTSPRNTKKPQQPAQESVNLLANSMVASQKKKPQSSTKTPEQEFELTLTQIRLDELEKELNNLSALFPSNWLMINQHLAIYINQRFSHIPDFDPNSSHENETTSLLIKADNKLSKFLAGTVSKLPRADTEKLFEFLFQSLFADSNKSPSNHGYKIYTQLLVKHANGLGLGSTTKLNEILARNKHQHQRCLIALWALSQIGYINLPNGLKMWFECMLPLLNSKGSTLYVATYLNSLLNHHKITRDSTVSAPKLIDFEQYSRLFDVVNDKSLVISKEAAQRLRQAYELLRACLVRDMYRTPEDYFEVILAELKAENSARQDDLLDMLANMLINKRQLLSKWKQIYPKYIGQSVLLLENLSSKHLKSMKGIKSMGETLKYFDQHSSGLLAKQKDASSSAKNFYAKGKSGKSNETDQLKKFNRLVKQLISDHFRRTSRLSMVFRSILILGLIIGFFFYWDINLNKSVYTKSIQVELKKYGLLEPTLKLINSVKNLITTVQNLLAYYIPIWYQKFNQVVVPVVLDGWKVSKEYLNIAWVKSGPYRELVVVYVNQGVDFIHANFPVVMKNLISVFQLAINYATTVFNFVVYYVFQGIDFVGIQLLGWKKGDLEKAFLDAIKVSMEHLTQLFQKLTAYLNQK